MAATALHVPPRTDRAAALGRLFMAERGLPSTWAARCDRIFPPSRAGRGPWPDPAGWRIATVSMFFMDIPSRVIRITALPAIAGLHKTRRREIALSATTKTEIGNDERNA
jgi:hypothetical protein